MAVKTYRLALGNDGNFGALSESDVAAANRTDGWTPAKIAAVNMSNFDAAVKQTSATFFGTDRPTSLLTGTTANAVKIPSPLTGRFAAADWIFTFAVRCTTASAQRGRIRLRVFKSVNADGSGATEVTFGTTLLGTTVASALSTSADQTSIVTWSPGTTITLNNEYLFFAFAWEITTAGGSNSADVVLRTGQSAAGTRIVTPDFVVPVTHFGAVSLPVTFGKSVEGIHIPGSPYKNAILADGPTGYWRMEESGLPQDLSSSNNHLTGDTRTVAQVTGLLATEPISKARGFVAAGGGSQVNRGGLLYPLNTFSIEMWVKRTRTNVQEVLLSQYNGGLGVVINADGTIVLNKDFVGPCTTTSTLKILDTNIHHIVITRNGIGGEVKFYLDGVSETPTPSAPNADFSAAATNGFFIGSQWGNTPFDGTLDEVAIYPFVLSFTQVLNHYILALGIVPVDPLDTTLIDDFNRADGPAHAGAGADIWDSQGYGSTNPSTATISTNALSGGPMSKFKVGTDFDLLYDIATVTAGTFTGIMCCIRDSDKHSSLHDAGFTVGFDWGTQQWWPAYYADGAGYAIGQGGGGGAPQLGETFWWRKRGGQIQLYRKPSGGGLFTLAGTWGVGFDLTGPLMIGNGPGYKTDNVRGGPLIPPPITYFGASSLVLNYGQVVSGRKTTFSSVLLPIAFGAAVAGRRKTLGQLALPIIFSKDLRGQRKTFGQIALPINVSIATAGNRLVNTLYGAISLPITFAKDVAGRRKAFGQLALPITFFKDVRGVRKTFGQLLAPFLFSKDVRGQRKTFGQISLPINLSVATDGIVRAAMVLGATSMSVIFGKDVKAQRKTFGQTALPMTFAKDVVGRRRTFGQVSFPIIFTKEAVGRRNVFGQLSMQTLFGKETAGRRRTFSQFVMSTIFSKDVRGRKQTFGQIARPINIAIVVNGNVRHNVRGSLAMTLTFNKQIVAYRNTFGKTASPFIFGSTSQGRRRTTSQMIFPINFLAIVKTGHVGAHGQIEFPIIVSFKTDGIRIRAATILNNAIELYLGEKDVLAAYVGSEKVWP